MHKVKGYDYLILAALVVLLALPLHSMISHYVLSDQYHYRRFYEALSNVDSVFQIFIYARSMVGSGEVFSPLILWFGSYLGIDKDIYITGLNLLLVSVVYLSSRRLGINFLFVPLILTNFYLVVLFTGAERLKIGFLFALLVPLADSSKARFALVFVSCLAHFQMIIFWAGIACFLHASSFIYILKNHFFKVKKMVFVAIVLVLIFIINDRFMLLDKVMQKSAGYASYERGWSDLIQFFLMTICFIVALKFRLRFRDIMFIVFFLVSILILGGQRVNMIYVIAVFGVLAYERRLVKNILYIFPIYLVMIYLSFKSIGFVSNIYHYGTGFI